jgi:Tfp pilus assembly protein PilN
MQKDNMEKVLGFSSELAELVIVDPCQTQPDIDINTFLEQLHSDYMTEASRLQSELTRIESTIQTLQREVTGISSFLKEKYGANK